MNFKTLLSEFLLVSYSELDWFLRTDTMSETYFEVDLSDIGCKTQNYLFIWTLILDSNWFFITYLCKILHGVVALTAKEIATLEIASVFKNIQSRATQTDTFIDKHNWQHYAKITYTILHTSAKIAWASLAHNGAPTFVKSNLNFTTLFKLFILLQIKTCVITYILKLYGHSLYVRWRCRLSSLFSVMCKI